jgi:hypothetical protein
MIDREYRATFKYFTNAEGTVSAKHESFDDRFRALNDDL